MNEKTRKYEIELHCGKQALDFYEFLNSHFPRDKALAWAHQTQASYSLGDVIENYSIYLSWIMSLSPSDPVCKDAVSKLLASFKDHNTEDFFTRFAPHLSSGEDQYTLLYNTFHWCDSGRSAVATKERARIHGSIEKYLLAGRPLELMDDSSQHRRSFETIENILTAYEL